MLRTSLFGLLGILTGCSYPNVHFYTDATTDTITPDTDTIRDIVSETTCSDLQTDPNNCGSCGRVCSAPQGASPLCSSGQCDWNCNVGFYRTTSGCDVQAPRPTSPLSFSVLSTQTPLLRWTYPSGVSAATVEVCRDSAMTMNCQVTDANASEVTLPTALPRGLWFWRLRGKVGGIVGDRTSSVWNFWVGTQNSTRSTVLGQIPDINRDGLADIVAAALGSGVTTAYLGNTAGDFRTPFAIFRTPDPITDGFFGTTVTASDFNGDGFLDLAIGQGFDTSRSVYLYLGDAQGIPTSPSGDIDCSSGNCDSQAAGGDINGDGYGDLLVNFSRNGSLGVFLGSPGGLPRNPTVSIPRPDLAGATSPFSVCAGDVNGDGFVDAVVGSPQHSNQRGRLVLLAGSAQGLASTATLTLDGENVGDRFGTLCSLNTDVDGNGLPDLVVSAPNAPNGGKAYLFLANGASLATNAIATIATPNSSVHLLGARGAGDVDGDGFGDIIASAETITGGGMGAAQLFLGAMDGQLRTSTVVSGFDVGWGSVRGSPGDVDGDGRFDVVIGSPDSTNVMLSDGSVVLFRGAVTGLVRTPFATITSSIPAELGRFGAVIASY